MEGSVNHDKQCYLSFHAYFIVFCFLFYNSINSKCFNVWYYCTNVKNTLHCKKGGDKIVKFINNRKRRLRKFKRNHPQFYIAVNKHYNSVTLSLWQRILKVLGKI